MVTHHLDTSPENLHGWFDRTLPPRLRVASGDTVIYRTRESGWRERPPAEEPNPPRPEGAGHCLSGPVYVEGAEPGDTLEVRIREIVPTDWGVNAHTPGKRAISGLLGGEPDDMTERYSRTLSIDTARGVAGFLPGVTIPLDPFMGIYATCPDADGPVRTAFPGDFGGNMDCKELRAGTTLYLPVFVPGALFSTGDGHAAQGDGEVSGTAIEAGMERLVLEFAVRKDMRIARPCAESDAHLIFLAVAEDLDAACQEALRDTMRYLVTAHGLTRGDAYALCSMAVDFRITQVVDGPRGVHAMLPKAVFADGKATFSAKTT